MLFKDYVEKESTTLEERRELILLENVLSNALVRVRSGQVRPDSFLAANAVMVASMHDDVYNAVERAIHARLSRT